MGASGRIATRARDVIVSLTPVDKVSAKAPDFIAKVGQHACGAAWRVSDASGAVLRLKLDDPTWPEPIGGRVTPAGRRPPA